MSDMSQEELRDMWNMLKEEREEKHKTASVNQLSNALAKRFQTVFIGAIAAFEEEFGELWGKDLPPNRGDKREGELYEKWQNVRRKILNNGNNQIRSALLELENYEISKKKVMMKWSVNNE